MTPQQNACLIAIRDLTVDGVSPSFRELMEYLGEKSSSKVHERVCALEDDGFIRRKPGRARNIEIIERHGGAISDARIASMSAEALESAATRIGAALAHRIALSQAMRERAGA